MELLKIIDFIALSATATLFFVGLKYSVAIITNWVCAVVSGGYHYVIKDSVRAPLSVSELYQFISEALFYGVTFLSLPVLVSSMSGNWGMGEFTLILAGSMLLATPSILYKVDKLLKGNNTAAVP